MQAVGIHLCLHIIYSEYVYVPVSAHRGACAHRCLVVARPRTRVCARFGAAYHAAEGGVKPLLHFLILSLFCFNLRFYLENLVVRRSKMKHEVALKNDSQVRKHSNYYWEKQRTSTNGTAANDAIRPTPTDA